MNSETTATAGAGGGERAGARQVARHLPGPFLSRVCIRTREGYRWGECLVESSPSYLDAPHLLYLQQSLAGTPAARYARVPTLADDRTSVHSEVSTAALLSDVVFSDDGCTHSWVRDSFAHLGAFLAHLHAVPVTSAALPLRQRAAWLDAAPTAAAGIGNARAALERTDLPIVRIAAQLDDAPPNFDPDRAAAGGIPGRLVHGRFSTASCVPGALPLVLGWREAGVGEPWEDLAYLLRDLIQAAVATGGTDAKARCAQIFVSSYQDARGSVLTPGELARLTLGTAARIVDHVALRAWAASDQRGALALLRGADRVLPEVLAAVGRRRAVT
ncbi:phosphotransferase [Streptomyces griseus]|uniref:phosphotransferase n=1 Tax=Streptomyces griseus TaxID=1911 RepID=UPI0033DC9B5C